MKIEKLNQLSEVEFQRLASTELYAELIKNRLAIKFNTSFQEQKFLESLEHANVGVWHYRRVGTESGVLHITLSAEKVVEKLINAL